MSIEEQFFKTFGIEPSYSDECAIADKYWANEELANKYVTFDKYMKKECGTYPECLNPCSYAYEEQHYPKITDRILLELICILVNFGTSITLVKGSVDTNVEALKRLVLNAYITTKGFDKEKVRSLFEEVEENEVD